jgi:hypothetical protein
MLKSVKDSMGFSIHFASFWLLAKYFMNYWSYRTSKQKDDRVINIIVRGFAEILVHCMKLTKPMWTDQLQNS